MEKRLYFNIVGTIFGAVALLHLLRSVMQWSFVIENFSIPLWWSWITVVVIGYLSYLSFKLARK